MNLPHCIAAHMHRHSIEQHTHNGCSEPAKPNASDLTQEATKWKPGVHSRFEFCGVSGELGFLGCVLVLAGF